MANAGSASSSRTSRKLGWFRSKPVVAAEHRIVGARNVENAHAWVASQRYVFPILDRLK